MDDERQGKGVFRWASGDRYEGDFVKNYRTGKGHYTWADGMDYEGDFVNNVRTGEGKVLWANGDGYEGTFLNDDPTGKGTYFYKAGWSFDEVEGILTITKDLRFKTHMFDTIRDRVFSVTASKGARITNGFDLFWGMKGLSEVDLSELDVSACENMCGMFRSCPSLTELDLRNWNTERVKDVSHMFD